ncbi:hypothetical protein F3Y22_tig00112050pilonHSYRG00001 [Hibiscus syriacus]|uniref:Uncharacterized protein n=1 Tax=Hibiscus syriacus TaxID=106335 RepID=A0A6A2X6U3_HIBSY|nr:hypothetical protein F3Y22_tig00112050pilonHSYRG00001 [Hibiscus syriacus]
MEVRALDSMTRNGDFLDGLLDQCEENASYFTRQNIKPLILNLFIAGSDTSALTTEWAMAELLRKPKVLQKTKRELMEVIGMEPKELCMNQTLIDSHIFKLSSKKLCGSILWLLFSYLTKSKRISKYAATIYRRTLSFWFIDSSLDFRGRDFEYIPFGGGRRICSGMPLAVRMVHLMLASMIHSFDWKLPHGMNPQDLDMQEQFGTTLRKAVPLCVVPIYLVEHKTG